jgi:hypothetical protein
LRKNKIPIKVVLASLALRGEGFFVFGLCPKTKNFSPNGASEASTYTQNHRLEDISRLKKIKKMIQRIQSIFLLIASIASGAGFLSPLSIGNFKNAPTTLDMAKDGVLNVFDNMGLMAITALVAGVSLITLFLFKNRALQMNLIKGLLGVSIVSLILIGWLIKSGLDAVSASEITDDSLTLNPLGLILPFVAIIFSVLAYRAIKKDENLVRSADRLR